VTEPSPDPMMAMPSAATPTLDLSVPRRTHPASPVVLSARLVPVVYLGMLIPLGGIWEDLGFPAALGAGIATVIIALIAAGFGWWSWAKLTYYLDDDGDLHVDSGIFQRQARRLQLSRLQSVDAVSPLIARLLGFVEVRIEVAGAGDSRAVLRYLTKSQAEDLRVTILAKASQRAQTETVTSALGAGLEHDPRIAEIPGANLDGDLLASVPSGRLLGSLLLRTVTVTLFILTVLFVLFTIRTQGATSLIVAIVTGGVPLFAVVSEFFTYSDFTVSRTRDGLRLRHGLLQTQTRTVPVGRIQAVEIIAPLLWRRFQWVRVQLTVAGVGGEGQQTGRAVLLPVAPREQALSIIGEVLPGVVIDELPWVSAPRRARWRAPIQWSFLAWAATDQVIATRTGRITRRISLAPHARNQSVRVVQGPWQRSLRLATVAFDVAPGPVTLDALQVDQASARGLANDQADRARLARLNQW
jgi:putative membrane protein